jgi:hypothetical protein
LLRAADPEHFFVACDPHAADALAVPKHPRRLSQARVDREQVHLHPTWTI